MRGFAMKAFIGMLAVGTAMPAFAADLYEPAPEPAPLPVVEAAPAPVQSNGWYIRGDLGYGWNDDLDTEYTTYGINQGDPADPLDDIAFGGTGELTGELKGAMTVGAGIGYQVNDYFRTDFTADYMFDSDFEGSSAGTCSTGPCVSEDRSSYSALLLLANAYVDLGTYGGFTPYVGAGIGGARVKWDNLTNTTPDGSTEHEGAASWRFAAAAMVGASYCLTDRVKLDAGYRFAHIEGGKMFEYASDALGAGVGPGYDDGFNIHQVRAGVRYALGGSASGCAEPEAIAYEPPPAPVAEAVYK